MSEEQDVRKHVSVAYAKAVCAPSENGPCCTPTQKGVAVKVAGYTSEELESLPADAVVNSFGCGNPLAFSDVTEGEVVVDLGSGAGIDILLAAKKVGSTGRVIGIDMTDAMIDRANENIKASGLSNVEVRKGIIEELPVDSDSVDWVISNCVINLSPEKHRVFSEIGRVLRPGGRMLVSDIVVESMPESIRGHKVLYSSCVAGAISEEEYIHGLREAGLCDVEVRERIVYDRIQLESFIKSELPDNAAVADGCCEPGSDFVRSTAESLGGKIWSAKFFARKL